MTTPSTPGSTMPGPGTLDALRRRIRLLERPAARDGAVLPFGVAVMDDHLPEGGLVQAGLHEVSGGGADAAHGACAALFAAGILARIGQPVLWCAARQDVFPPGLAGAGLPPDRVIYAEAADDRQVLLVMEEALRHAGLAAVVGEVSRLEMTASRRLVLAAEKSGVMALALRRLVRDRDEAMTAAATRWCVTPLPSLASVLPGLGRARWKVELTRSRGGRPGNWVMEACDAQGCLAVPAALADGQGASDTARLRVA